MEQNTEMRIHFSKPLGPRLSSPHQPTQPQGSPGTSSKIRKPTLLIVDDESEIRDVISDLVADKYHTIQAEDAEQAIEKARRKLPSLILLDIMMPGRSGIEACEQLRKDPQTQHIPIIMLTAASKVDSRIRSFVGGADDFIAKPFNAEELISRIDSKIRRFEERRIKPSSSWACGNLSLSRNEPFAQMGEQRIQLTPVEYSILKILIKNADELVSRSQVMKIWGEDASGDRLIDAHLTSLRKKLAGFTGNIRAVYGKGYILTSSSTEAEK